MTRNTKIVATAILGAASITLVALSLSRETTKENLPESGNKVSAAAISQLPEGNLPVPPVREEKTTGKQSPGDPEPEVKPSGTSNGEQESRYVAPTQLESNLDVIAETFATEVPDIDMLLDVTGVLANAMDVVPGSLVTDAEGNITSGELQLGENLNGSFKVKDGNYSIELMRTDATADSRHQITFEFEEEEGNARNAKIRLQSYANKTEGAPSLGGKVSIGWHGSIDQDSGSYFQRTKMTILDLGVKNYLYETNDDADFEPMEVPHVSNTDSFTLWRTRLQGIR